MASSEGKMLFRYGMLFGALLFLSNFAMAQNSSDPNSTSWSGVIVNSGCTADEAFAEASKCSDNIPGSKLVLYDDTVRQIFELDPQTLAAGHLGDSVTVAGRLEGKTIHVASVEPLTSFGLATGKKAPPFSLRDQFGQTQTLESLKSAHGTVLLFFRSADW